MADVPLFRDITLTGWRALVHRTLFLLLAAAALIAFIGYLAPGHRIVGDAQFHSNYTDGGMQPVACLLGAIGAVLLFMRGRTFGFGIAAAVAVGAAFVGALQPILLVHMFSHVESAWGEHLLAVGMMGMMFGCLVRLVSDPVLFLLERRRLVIASRPAPLPMAVAVR